MKRRWKSAIGWTLLWIALLLISVSLVQYDPPPRQAPVEEVS